MRATVPWIPGCLALLLGLTGRTLADPVVTPLVSGPQVRAVRGITNDGSNLYLTDTSLFPQGRVLSVPLAGGAVATVATYSGQPPQGSGSPLGITALGASVYWIDPNSGPFTDPEILKASKAGGPVSRIFTGSAHGFPFGSLDGSGLTNDGSRLYWADEVGGRVYGINPDGTGITQLGGDRYPFGFGPEHLNSIAYAQGTLYIADSGKAGVIAPQVVSIPTSGGSFTTLFAGAPFGQLTGIAVGDNTLYVSDALAKTIWQLPLSGGILTPLVTDSRFNSIYNLTYFDHALYVADPGTDSGTIWKVDLNGPSAVPEPASLTLIGLGVLGFLGLGLRRRSTSGALPSEPS